MEQKFRGTEVLLRNYSAGYEGGWSLHADHLDIAGNVIAVVGHNGAGKSTFIKSVLGPIPLSRGSLEIARVDGDTRTVLTPEDHMAFCPETGSVFADIKVIDYIKLWCRMKHRDTNYYKKAGSNIVDLLKLDPLFSKLGRELSKGQRRRVQTAIGFLSRPKLFLFDEPFDGLDVQKTSDLADIVRMHLKDTSFVISSHRMDVVERLADIVVVLQEGEFVSCGPVPKVCLALCRQSVIIRNLDDAPKLLSILKAEFPRSIAIRVGRQIRLIGEFFEVEQVEAIVSEYDTNGAELRQVQPSLVDAMNYHLKLMDDQGKN